ncbi:MAG: alpha/beta hydrolase [Oligoflexales bacterium]|nr:alpha/beta hydrolase [Oligoflexales bacterium]
MKKNEEKMLKDFCLKNNCQSARIHSLRGDGAIRFQFFYPNLGKEAEPSGIVLFAHGAGNDAIFPNFTLFRSLLQKKLIVSSFDIDGHGHSSSTYLDTDLIFNLIDHVIRDLPHLIQKTIPKGLLKHSNGPLDLHLVGHSLGAALLYHRIQEERPFPKEAFLLRSLTLISMPLSLKLKGSPLPYIFELLSVGSLSFWKNFKTWKLELITFGRLKRKNYPFRIKLRSHRWFFHDFIGTVSEILKKADLLKNLGTKNGKRLNLPTLLCYSALDSISPIHVGETLASAFSNSKLLTYEGETHYSLVLTERLANDISEFIAQQGSK